MAKKGVQKFVDKVFGIGKKEETPQMAMRKDQEMIAKNRTSAENMIAKLGAINLNDPKNKLSHEIIISENLEDTIAWAIEELKEPTIFSRDIGSLDEKIEYAVDALIQSIREGLITTARWSATALYQSLSSLRQEMGAINKTNSDEFYKQRLEYATMLQNMIGKSYEYDTVEEALRTHRNRYERDFKKQQEMKEKLEEKKNTFAGRTLVEDIRKNAHNPAAMSDEAKELKQEFEKYHMLRGSVTEMYVELMTKTAELNEIERVMTSMKNQLAQLPVAHDPQLNARIERANKMHLQDLMRTLDEIDMSSKMREQYLSKMKQLSNHKVFQDKAAEVLNTINEMDREKQKELDKAMAIAEQAKKETEKSMRRIETLKQKKQEVEELQKQQKLAEEEFIREMNAQAETEAEEVEETEAEAETEFIIE